MNYHKLCCAALLSVGAIGSMPAYAADFFLIVGPGTSSTDFGNTGDSAGNINDRYFFTVPGGSANGQISSIALNEQLDVDFTDVTLDDIPFETILADGTELRTLAPTLIAGGLHAIYVTGTWGPEGGSYSGTLNFAPAAVPEPLTWVMLIGGLGAIGGTLRHRRARMRTSISFA